MRKDEFVAGEEWAYRQGQQLGTPASRVELVAMPKRKGRVKVKIRHLEGELEGMEEFVNPEHLRCPWKGWWKVERDEAKEQTFLEYMAHQGELERAVTQAATAVLLSSGEDLLLDEHRNYSIKWGEQVTGLERVADRAGVEGRTWTRLPSFTDRNGGLYVQHTYLVQLAMAFAKAEPETVNLYLDVEEQELLREGYQFGELYPHRRVLQQRPAWALARQWTAGADGRDHLLEEKRRLERLLYDAIGALKDAGEERKATRLERAWRGR